MSDVLTFEQECEIRNEKIVRGYIKTKIIIDSVVPDAIIDLCFKFYHILPEMFDINKTHKDIEISSDKLTASKKAGSHYYPNVYGTFKLESKDGGRYQWKVIIEREKEHGDIMVGIATDPNKNDDYKNINYAYQTHGGMSWKSGSQYRGGGLGIPVESGEELIMDVDFEKRQISYIANGKNQGIMFKDVVIGPIYYFAASLNICAKSITIKEFECVFD